LVALIKKLSFERDEPLFGLDIGHSNMKVFQLDLADPEHPAVLGYGISGKYPDTTLGPGGDIVQKEVLAQSMLDLFKNRLVGSISTKKVACTIPTAHTFSRLMNLPLMEDDQIAEAVHLEVEQYIPMPPDTLYMDYEISRKTDTGLEVLMVATPRKIIDSFMDFINSMGLEPVALEPTMNASARLFQLGGIPQKEPSVLVDFGSTAIDIAIYDQALFVNSTLAGGSESLTVQIAKKLKVSMDEAFVIKCLNGIGESKNKEVMMSIVKPQIDSLVKEVQKMMRYYSERTVKEKKTIGRVLALGGGSNMPGFIDYLSKQLNMPVQIVDPWQGLEFGSLRQLSDEERTVYLTVTGVSLINPSEAFA
jgi:type IV pilus assembly protein PilM